MDDSEPEQETVSRSSHRSGKIASRNPIPAEPLPAPKSLSAPEVWPKSLAVAELELGRASNGRKECARQQPGEAGAGKMLKQFLASAFTDYTDKRNRPDLRGTSRLSPHLHFGEISPRQIWHGCDNTPEERRYDLAHFPVSGRSRLARVCIICCIIFRTRRPSHCVRTSKISMAERCGVSRGVAARTDRISIVDAGMRELWTTGWMHNRVRMIVASFLVKDFALVARGCGVVLGYARGRGPRAEHAWLAMDGWLWRGCRAVFPRVQSGEPG